MSSGRDALLRSETSGSASTYLWDLQVVELLLPLDDVVDPGEPDVDVAHQDTPAGVDGQTLQRQAQVLQQLLDQARVVLVLYDWWWCCWWWEGGRSKTK